MKLYFIFYENAFLSAVENNDFEVVKLLLSNDKIDPNMYAILKSKYIFIQFQIYIFLLCSKIYLFIIFKIRLFNMIPYLIFESN